MSTINTTPAIDPQVPWPLYTISLEQYDAMVESGLFTERDRLQLIGGILVAKATRGDDHCMADDLCRVALSAVLPAGWFVRPPGQTLSHCRPMARLSPTKPCCVVRSGITGDGSVASLARDLALVVEVAQSSLAQDRAMTHAYGKAGIPIYWIINLVDRQVEVYSDPEPHGYATRDDYQSGQAVPVVLDGVVVGFIAVDDVLP